MRPARLLILRGGALGDFIVTLPVLAALRERWPEAEIELVGYPGIAHLARKAGLVNRVTSLHGAQIARFFSLRPEFPPEQVDWIRSFDFIFSYLHDPDGTVVNNLHLAGARTVLYGSPLVHEGHAIDHLVKPLQGVALYVAGAAARLPLGSAAADEGRRLLEAHGVSGPFALLHPGSGSPRKNWPAKRFVELARRLGAERDWTPAFLTGEADEVVAAALRGLAPDILHLRSMELGQVANVLAAAAFYAGNDSGITHLAAALGTPVLAIFGPSDPAQWAPRGSHVRVVRASAGDLTALTVDEVLAVCRA